MKRRDLSPRGTTESPWLTEGYPLGWRPPNLAIYDGLTDPEDHLHSIILYGHGGYEGLKGY